MSVRPMIAPQNNSRVRARSRLAMMARMTVTHDNRGGPRLGTGTLRGTINNDHQHIAQDVEVMMDNRSSARNLTGTYNGFTNEQMKIGEMDPTKTFSYRDKFLIKLDSAPYKWTAPTDRSLHPYKDHQGEGAQYLRDFILGINDGLISTLLIVIGLVGGGANNLQVLLAGFGAAVAGAIAMGLGELIATKAQNEVIEGEKVLEMEHFKYHRDVEIEQLRGFLRDIGFEQPLLEAVVKQIARNDENMLKAMEKFEFGGLGEANDDLGRSPLTAMFMSGRLFFIGAMPSVLPFLQPDPTIAISLALVLCGWALLKVGVYKTQTTGGDPYRGAMENFGAGAVGGAIAFLVGFIFQQATGITAARAV